MVSDSTDWWRTTEALWTKWHEEQSLEMTLTYVIDICQHLVADAECPFFHLSVDGKSTVGMEENNHM